ncbi:MAG: TIGR02449 family protein [Gammaproteobacteria bacterium]|nr:TIGR02449 family protein [Gammaproteobacteria bacterium]MCW8910875.1 TIGR02449 family protein [Gammaproteobacteria bacterium]MCW9004357.1 TIGR02449 family protein [Gammaproteobacteria bacterium]MCW9056782.1 TIGR02449 family protein [Gammaproteobacteria bacterium]
MTKETQQNIDDLEHKVEELLALTRALSEENKQLKSQLHSLKTDRSTLVEQKEKVRTQVESMISRLKSMETA